MISFFSFSVITVIVCAPVRAACGLDVQLMRGQGWEGWGRGGAFTSPSWSEKTGLRCINTSDGVK